MGRTEKAASVAELREKLTGAQGAVLTDYRGLSVAEMTELRSLLRKSAVEYRVVKNTLAKIAIRGTDVAGLAQYLEGPTAIAVSRTDPVAPAKVLAGWGRGRGAFPIKGGVVEGQVVGPEAMRVLGDLPPREVLLGQVAGAFQAPLQALVQVLTASMRELANVLDQVRQQKEQAKAA